MEKPKHMHCLKYLPIWEQIAQNLISAEDCRENIAVCVTEQNMSVWSGEEDSGRNEDGEGAFPQLATLGCCRNYVVMTLRYAFSLQWT